jgi:hypothetical protein
VTIRLTTPADKREIILFSYRGQSLQLSINIAARFDLPPQPHTVGRNHLIARSVFADFEWIAEQRWSADVNAFTAICLSVLDPNHLQFSFLSVIKLLPTARTCLHSADHSDREERWRIRHSLPAIAPVCFRKDSLKRDVAFISFRLRGLAPLLAWLVVFPIRLTTRFRVFGRGRFRFFIGALGERDELERVSDQVG